jgi:hypothetical protein
MNPHSIRIRLLAGFGAVLALAAPVAASADVVAIAFTGTIATPGASYATWQADNSIYAGETVTGTLTYDPSLFTSEGPAAGGTLFVDTAANAATLTVQVGSQTFTADNPGAVIVTPTLFDMALVPTAPSPISGAGCPSAPYTVQCVGFALSYDDAAFSGDQVPDGLPTDFAVGASSYLYYYDAYTYPSSPPSEGFYVSFTDIAPDPVLEPSSLMLIGIPVLLVGLVRGAGSHSTGTVLAPAVRTASIRML